MSADEISPMAKFHAERILRGEGVSDTEMRIVTAGLMLSVDELTHVVKGLSSQLWTEEKLRQIIGEEVTKHCAGKSKECASQSAKSEPQSARWFGRMLRSLAGIR
jgi:hypothetical protein